MDLVGDITEMPHICASCQRKVNHAWHCTNCKKRLCYSCKYLHAKSLATRLHVIVETKDLNKTENAPESTRPESPKDKPSPPDRPPPDASSVESFRIRENCKEHDESLLYHCRTCIKPACNACVEESHKTHDLINLEQFIKTEKDQLLLNASDAKKNHIVELRTMLQSCATKREDSKNGLNNANDRLNEHVQKLMAEVESVADSVTDDLKSLHARNEYEINKTESQINEAINIVDDVVSMCENSLDESIYQVYQAKKKMAYINGGRLYPKQPLVHSVDFEKGQINRSLLSKMICTSITKEENTEEKAIKDKQVRPISNKPQIPKYEMDRFNLSDVGISCMSVATDQSVTVQEPRTAKGIQKVLIKHGTKLDTKEPLEFDKYVTDVCCYDSRSTLVTFVNTGAIKVVNQNGKIATFADLTPLFPASLWKTSEGAILVSVVERDEREIYDDSTRAVYILSITGRIMKKIEYFRGKRTLNRPYRAIENTKGEIIVIDFIDLDDRVVWMKKNGEGICSYFGHFTPKYPRLMAAQGLACDKNNRIYISDARNNVIHVVDGAGKFVCFIENDTERFFSPWALCVDDNKLWIGTSSGSLFRTYIHPT